MLVEFRASIARPRRRRPSVHRAGRNSGPSPSARDSAILPNCQEIEDRRSEVSWEARVAERRASIWRAFVTFSIASTLALILIGSIYALVRRYLAERSKADRTLRESEARVRLLLDSAGEGVYGVDVCEGICTFCNPAALQLLGFESADQVLGRNMHDLIHHTHSDGGDYDVEPARSSGRSGPARDPRRGRHLLEGRRDVDPRRIPSPPDPPRRRDPRRRRDLRRRRAQAPGRDRDEAPRAGLEGDRPGGLHHRPRPVGRADHLRQRRLRAADRLQPGRGRPAGTSSSSEAPRPTPKAIEELMAAFRERREASVVMLSYRKDGSTFWDALTIAPVEGPDGRVTHFVGVVTDITATKRGVERLKVSEERLRLMIESVRDYAIFSIDLEGRVSSWNSGAERLFGYPSRRSSASSPNSSSRPEDRVADVPRLELLAEPRRPAGPTTSAGTSAQDGSKFFASGMVTAVRDEVGHPAGLYQGGPRHHRIEASRGRASGRQGSGRGRQPGQEFVPGQHEPRAPDPLNAIIGYSEMLEEEAREQGVGEFVPDLERIHTAGKHLLGPDQRRARPLEDRGRPDGPAPRDLRPGRPDPRRPGHDRADGRAASPIRSGWKSSTTSGRCTPT